MPRLRRARSFRVASSSISGALALLSALHAAAAEPESEPALETPAPSVESPSAGAPPHSLPEAPVAPRALEEPAQASVQPMHAAAGMARVRLSAGEHAFQVYFGRGEHPIAACPRACDFWAWPGEYLVRVTDGEAAHVDSVVPLRVQSSGSYVFVPANGSSQNAGLILGVSGPVVGVVGLVLTGIGLGKGCDDSGPGSSCARPSAFYLGLGAVALGAVMTTTGWLVYAHNRAQFRASGATPVRPPPRVSFRPLQIPGLGLTAQLTF